MDPEPPKLGLVHINIYKEKSNNLITQGDVACSNPYQTTWLQLLHQNNQFHYDVECHEIQGLLHRLREQGRGEIVQSDLNCLVSDTLDEWKQKPTNGKYKVHLVTKSVPRSRPVPVPAARDPVARVLAKLIPQPGLVVVREESRVVPNVAREEPQKMVQVVPQHSTSRQMFGNETRGMGMEADDPSRFARPPSQPFRIGSNNEVWVLPPKDKIDTLTPDEERAFMYTSPAVLSQLAKEEARRSFLPQYLQPQTTRQVMIPAQVVQQQVNVQARRPVAAQQQAPPQVALAQAQQQGLPPPYRLVNGNMMIYQGGHFRIIPQPQNQMRNVGSQQGIINIQPQNRQLAWNYNGYNQNHHGFVTTLVYQPQQLVQAAPQFRRVTVTPPSPASQAVDMRPQNRRTPNPQTQMDMANGTGYFLFNNKFL